MRLKDDEQAVLRGLVSGSKVDVAIDRAATIRKTFRYLGYVDADDLLTPRGRHVASKLPRLSESEPEPVEVSEPIEFTEKTDWD